MNAATEAQKTAGILQSSDTFNLQHFEVLGRIGFALRNLNPPPTPQQFAQWFSLSIDNATTFLRTPTPPDAASVLCAFDEIVTALVGGLTPCSQQCAKALGESWEKPTLALPTTPPPTPIEPYELPCSIQHDSHVELARVAVRVLQDASPATPVADEGALWRYNTTSHTWTKQPEQVIKQAVQSLDRLRIESGTDEKTGKTKYRALKVKDATVRGVINQAMSLKETWRERFFVDAPRGVQFRNVFVGVHNDGTLNLQAPHPKLRQRFGVPYAWKEDLSSQRWEGWLRDWLVPARKSPEEEEKERQILGYCPYESGLDSIKCLQEFAGAMLFGIAPRYGRCLMLTGEGENGKSKFIKALEGLLPEDAKKAYEPSAFTAYNAEYNIAEMAGVRLNSCPDISTRSLEDTSKLKLLITGETLMGRRPRGEPFKVESEGAFLFSANKLPRSSDRTHGFWRRFLVVPFVGYFPKGDPRRDPDLDSKIVEERAGIYAWAIRGAQRLIRNGGYTIPAASEAALRDWREGQDFLMMWARECLEVLKGEDKSQPTSAPLKGFWKTSQQLYDNYTEWCKANNHAAYGKGNWSKEMQSERYLGIIPKREIVKYTKAGKVTSARRYAARFKDPED